MKNVLILSAGRRVELIQNFIYEIKKRDFTVKLFAVDSNPSHSAGCQIADEYFKAPKVADPNYIQFLFDLCLRNKVGLVVPTIDTELLVLSQNRERFQSEGIEVAISDFNLISICRDKRLSSKLFDDLKISSPLIYEKDMLQFPCFAKPYDGSCSIGAVRLDSVDQLTSSMLADEKIMFMELIGSDYSEYTVDAYFDRNSALRCMVPRERLEVRAGEVSKGITRKNYVYEFLLPKLLHLKGARGCITLQLFVRHNPNDIKGIEINPRFGGGYPLSYSAGANYLGWLLDEFLLEKQIPFFDGWEENLLMLRYDAKILVREVH